MNKEDKYSLSYSIGKSIQENKDKIEKLEKQNIRFKKKNKQLQSQLDIANKKLEQVKNQVQTQQSIIKRQPSVDESIDNYILARLDTILSIIDRK